MSAWVRHWHGPRRVRTSDARPEPPTPSARTSRQRSVEGDGNPFPELGAGEFEDAAVEFLTDDGEQSGGGSEEGVHEPLVGGGNDEAEELALSAGVGEGDGEASDHFQRRTRVTRAKGFHLVLPCRGRREKLRSLGRIAAIWSRT